MLSVQELLKYYPEEQRHFREFILREYLQHKILQIIFDQPETARHLCFLGGTCLRIVHGNNRFSEDIDFDNLGMDEKGFGKVADLIEKQLGREGYEVEIKTVIKSAFHCHIRFPGILFQEGLSGLWQVCCLRWPHCRVTRNYGSSFYHMSRFKIERLSPFSLSGCSNVFGGNFFLSDGCEFQLNGCEFQLNGREFQLDGREFQLNRCEF